MFALIAGRGALPGVLVAHRKAHGEDSLVAALEGFAPADLAVDLTFRVETLGTLLLTLGTRGVRDVCFAGAIARPALDPTAIDAETLPLVPVMMQAMQAGDDGALRAVLDIFEKAGFRLHGIHALVPDLLPAAGVHTLVEPDDQARSDARRGAQLVAALGAVDVGQSCVVARAQVQAIEAQPGTDWMLRSLLARPLNKDHGGDQNRGHAGGVFDELLDFVGISDAPQDGHAPHTDPQIAPGGLLFKAPKPGQDRRIDLPVIGLTTVRNAAEAGLRGIVIEAGGVMIPDFAAVVRACDHCGMFLWVRDAARSSDSKPGREEDPKTDRDAAQ